MFWGRVAFIYSSPPVNHGLLSTTATDVLVAATKYKGFFSLVYLAFGLTILFDKYLQSIHFLHKMKTRMQSPVNSQVKGQVSSTCKDIAVIKTMTSSDTAMKLF